MVYVVGVRAYLDSDDITKRSSIPYTCPSCNVKHNALIYKCQNMSCPLNSPKREMCEQDRLKEVKTALDKYLTVKYAKEAQDKMDDVWRKLYKIL